MYDRILLPTDDSISVETAIEHAIDAAQRYDAQLHVLYVIDEEVYAAYSGDEYVHEREGLETALEQEGEDAITVVTEKAADAGIEVIPDVRHGVPHEEILAYADEADIDMLILGSKHRSGEYRQLLGSVAERVSRLSDRPVTIVKTKIKPRST